MAEPVRIAFVITELEVGGAERCLVNLASGIDRTRFAPTVCSLAPRPAAGKDTLVRQLEDASIPVHFLNLRSSISFLSGMSKLKRLLREHEIDVVQTFLFHANVIGAFAAQAAGVPKIVSGLRVADPARWRMALERFAARRAEYIVCVSHSVAEFVKTKVGAPDSKLRVIPNGIDLSTIPTDNIPNRTELGLPTERRILLAVGRLHRQKGLDWLLALAPELFKRLPEHDLVIVGDGPQRDSLTELSAKLDLQDRVHFIGWRPDVPRLMQAAEVFLLPSRWEGMPNVLIEAMGAGLPVVATSVEGVKEVLGPLAARQALPFGHDTAFIDAVSQFIVDSTLNAELGEENRERIRAEFTLRSMISKYEDLYHL
ncbi:MAG: glycosyltransferase [Planctomycetes bacterium]|nr:glycosyltransferase [Planctomycetota bacterium]